MQRISIIGCGAVGKTVGRLFHETGSFILGDVLTRSLQSARAAVDFIGAGNPVAEFCSLSPADLYLIAVSDDAIATCATALAETRLVRPGSVVCHLSGALSSGILNPVADQGARVASVHPVKSFADPRLAVADFTGTWCGIEGDLEAVELLSVAFSAIGGRPFAIDPAFKTVYHAGSVLVCNYLTALLEAGVRAYQKGGVPRETALEVMEPLVRGTVDNVFRLGTAQALTGPIARGDAVVVAAQCDALDAWDEQMAQIYRALGAVAADLAHRRGQVAPGKIAEVKRVLSTRDPESGTSGPIRKL